MTVHLPILVLLILAAVFPGLVQRAKQPRLALLFSFFCWIVELDRPGEGVAFYVKEQLNCMEFYLQSDEPVESLWAKIAGQINTGDTVVGVCYRPPKQEEGDETFRQLQDTSYLPALILMRNFNYLTVL